MDNNILDNTEDKYARVTLVSTHPKQLWVYKLSNHKDPSRGHFYIPLQEFPDVIDRVLKENWNIEDVVIDNSYEIFLQANVCFNDEIVKACYKDGSYRWISVREWLTTPEYKSANISEISLKPFYYKNDYNREMIAGQVRFVKIDISSAQPAPNQKYTKPKQAESEKLSSQELIKMVKALGLTPKVAIKMLLDGLEEV